MSDPPPHVHEAQAQAAAALHRPEVAAAATRQPATEAGVSYAGLVTRAIAFAIDAGVINGVALVVGVVVGLGLSILHLPEAADVVIVAVLGALWILWTVGYFAFFWSTTGQTPGDRVMRIQILDSRGRGPLTTLRAIIRFGWVIVAAIPLCAGFLIMLWDDRRRCLQDRMSRTIVLDAGPPPASARGLRR
jgi:uncharacterized RDD family membrane protein YckC